MEGNVLVPYTGIGGSNMNNGIMTLDLSGSSASADDATSRTINVLWTLPGGITNIKSRQDTYQGGEWGYLFETIEAGGQVVHDERVVEWVKMQVPGADFDGQNNLTTPELETAVEQAINNQLYSYVGRALKGEGDSSWEDFRNYFGKDICVFINF